MKGQAGGGSARVTLARTLFALSMAALLLTAHRALAPPAPNQDAAHLEREGAELDDLERRLRKHVEALAVPGGRSWRQPAVLAAAASRIEAFWKAQGYRVDRQPISGFGPEYANLLAFGGEGSWQGSPLLLAAHYDAVEGTPGADDNASGVAVLLEVSRLLTAPRAAAGPVVFAALTLEEPPFFGTERQGAWVLAQSLRRSRVALEGALVLEMVGYYRQEPGTQEYPFPLGLLGYPSPANFVGLVANRRSRHLLGPLAAGIEGAGLPVETLTVPGKGRLVPAIRLSDHAAFWDLGYPALMITDTSFYRNLHYHGPGDVPGTLDYGSMARLTLGLARSLDPESRR